MTEAERAAYEAGFRECQRRAADECSAVAGMAGMAARAGCEGLTWREVQGVLDEQATLIRALAPEAPEATTVNLYAERETTWLYRNWRGEVTPRRVIPQRLWHGSTRWHPKPQWLIDAWDCERSAMRSFALAGIIQASGWEPEAQEGEREHG